MCEEKEIKAEASLLMILDFLDTTTRIDGLSNLKIKMRHSIIETKNQIEGKYNDLSISW